MTCTKTTRTSEICR